MLRQFVMRTLSGAMIFCLATSCGLAATYTWNNSTTGNWNSATNWAEGIVPASVVTNDFVFDGTTDYTSTNNIGTLFKIHSLSVNNTAGTATIGSTNSMSFVNDGSTDPTITKSGAGAAVLGPILNIANNLTINVTADSGQLQLGSGANSNSDAFGTGSGTSGPSVTINNASAYDVLIMNVGKWRGSLYINSGNAKFTGDTGGDLFSAYTILNVAAGASFDFAGNGESMGGIAGGGVIKGANVTAQADGDRVFNGTLQGSMKFTQAASSGKYFTLTLGGLNTHTGGTQITTGAIQLAIDNSLPQTGTLTLGGGSTSGKFILNGYNQTLGSLVTSGTGTANSVVGGNATFGTLTMNIASGTQTYGGLLGGSGANENNLNLAVAGPGIFKLTNASNSFSGTVSVPTGTLSIDTINNAGDVGLLGTGTSAVVLGSSGTTGKLSLTGATASTTRDLNVADGGTGSIEITNSLTTLTLNGALTGTGTLLKTGPGTLGLALNGPFAGSANITNGTLLIDNSNSNGVRLATTNAVTLGGGTLALMGNSSAPTTVNLGGIVLTPGTSSKIQVTSGFGQDATLNLGTINRGASSFVDFTLPAQGNITTTSDLGVWATVNQVALALKSGNNIVAAVYSPNTFTGTTTNCDNTQDNSPASFTINSLRFNMPAPNTLTLTGVNTLLSGAILVTPNVGANAIAITGGTLRGKAGDALSIAQNATGEMTISSTIADNSGATGLNKFGSGNLVLSGTNTYTGATNIFDSGTLRLGTAASLPAGTALGVQSGATLDVNGFNASVSMLTGTGSITSSKAGAVSLTVNNTDDSTFSGSIGNGSGIVSVVKKGAGTLLLNGNNIFTGGTTIQGGKVSITSFASLGANNSPVVGQGGTLLYAAPGLLNFGGSFHPINFAGDLTVEIADPTGSLETRTDNWTGNGTLVKEGPGTLWLASSGAGHTGKVLVNNGVLEMTSERLQVISGLTIKAGAQWNIVDDVVNANFGFENGNLSLNGSGPNGTGAFLYTAQSEKNGACIIGNDTTLEGDTTFGVWNSPVYNFAYNAIFNGNISGPGKLTKIGSGTLTLGGVNNYAGGTEVLAGTLVGNSAAFSGNILNNGTVVFNQAFDGTFSQAISGSGALTKQGGGKLTLGGNLSYAGATTISGGGGSLILRDNATIPTGNNSPISIGLNGSLVLDNSGSVNLADRIPDAAPINLSGTLQLLGANGATTSETVDTVTINGAAYIDVQNGANGGVATLTMNAIQQTAGRGNFVIFSGSGVKQLANAPALSNGIMGGWAIYDNDWATYDGSGLVTLKAYAGYQTSANPNAWVAGDNVKVAAPPSDSLHASVSINSLNLASADTLNIDSGAVLRVTSGGMLVSANATVNGGTLVSDQPSNRELVVFVRGTDTVATIGSTIDDTAGEQALTKAGEGTLILSGTNNYSIATNIVGGVLQISDNTNLGALSAPVNLNGGTFRIANDLSLLTRAIVGGPGGGSIDTNGFSMSVGALTGTGNIAKVGDGLLTLTAAGTLSGGLTIAGGVVNLPTNVNYLGATGNVVTFKNGATLRYSSASSLNLSTNSPFSFLGDGVVDVTTDTVTLTTDTNGWTGNGTFTKTGPGQMSLGSSGSGHKGAIVVQQGSLAMTSVRTPHITGMTVMDGAQWMIRDDVNGANFSFDSGVVKLNGSGPAIASGSYSPALSGALRYFPQSDLQGVCIINNNVVLQSDSKIDVVNSASYIYQMVLGGNISGPGGLTKDNAGTLTLKGAPSYQGNTHVLEGRLEYDIAAGSTRVTAGQTLTIDPVSAFYTGGIVNAGGLVDPFTDSVDKSLHVSIINDGQFNVTAGTKEVGDITSLYGMGVTTVTGDATLTAHSIQQDTLIIGGAAVATTTVPEPSTIVLLLLAGLGTAAVAVRKQFARND